MYTYEAEVVAWIDGDTVALEVFKTFDMGFHVNVHGSYRGHFRLLGIDTPERGHLNFKEAREAAKLLAPIGSMVDIETEKADKYGRYLAKVVTKGGVNVAEALITMGLGVPYPKKDGEVAMWIGPAKIGLAEPVA